MLFVDGENLTFQSQELMKASGYSLIESPYWKSNCFFWPGTNTMSLGIPDMCVERPIRAFYYTSFVGDDGFREQLREQIHVLGFEPNVFKKSRQSTKAKGVDIALTKDMLSHAFRGNYDAALLIAGDADYVPLVEEVKRLGKRVEVHFVDTGMSDELRLASDNFIRITTVVQNFGFQATISRKVDES